MTKKTLLLLLITLKLSSAFSQFNEQIAWKSLVRVQVDGTGGRGTLTGFLWKDPSLIITALHGMKPNGKILIFYPDNSQSKAVVIKVFKDGDLVLLKADNPASLSDKIAPITTFQKEVTTGEQLTAMGFYGGAQAKSTQQFNKGSASPETIRAIAPSALEKEVNNILFPKIDFKIYYVSGSLLPGYSGCPIYNKNMELVAIGDGGLDKGQTNVSWCIPATNITFLENSTIVTLPETLGATSMNFTSDIPSPKEGNENTDNKKTEKDQQFNSFTTENFNFYLTKTRSWEEMQKTAIDPENMQNLTADFKADNLNLDYEIFDFDIYEDVKNGFVLAVPESSRFEIVMDEEDSFRITLSNELTDDYKYFDLFYYLTNREGDPVTNLINAIILDYTTEQGGGITIEPTYTKTYKLNDEWTADYRMFSADLPIYNPNLKEQVLPFYYICTIYNNEFTFNSVAVAYIPLDRKDLNDAFEKGIECVDLNQYEKNSTACDFLEAFMRIVASAHLTTNSSY
jgi:hypothetical protein